MSTHISREEVHSILNDALTTRTNLSKDLDNLKKMKHAALVGYCDKTINVCRAAIYWHDQVVRLSNKLTT